MVDEHLNSYNTPFKFNAKEFDAETGNYYYGARYYDPKFSVWLSVDPLVEKTFDAYGYCYQSPINLIDPDGRSAIQSGWIPKVDDNGAVSYIAEAGASAATLSSQYGISQKKAELITGTTGDQKIKEGTEITGEKVKQITGSEVLKLDLNSKEGKSEQRRFEQFMFAVDHSKTQDTWGFFTTSYFSNTQYKDEISGRAKFNIDGESFLISYRIPMYRSATFDGSGTGIYISNTPTRLYYTLGKSYNPQANITFTISHPKTAGQMGTFDFFLNRANSDRAYDRFKKEFPIYRTIRMPQRID